MEDRDVFSSLPEELRKMICYKIPILFFVSQTFAKPLLSVNEKMNVLLEMGYNVEFKKDKIVWRIWDEIIYENDLALGEKRWYKLGLYHRINGPAVEMLERPGCGTTQEHYPIEDCNVKKMWYLNGMLHRENGPAVEVSNGTKKWYYYGNLHRVNGPAIEFHYGWKLWYLNGKRIKVP